MWKYTVKYENFNGDAKEKELHFNLTKSELLKLKVSVEGGIDKYYKKLVDEGDSAKLIAAFDDIIRLAYGIKSEDGEEFLKSDKIYEEFAASAAYDAFFEYLTSSEDGVTNFINGIIPRSLREQLEKANAEQQSTTPEISVVK